jgi:hypothetical protein
MKEKGNSYMMRKPDIKISLGRPILRWHSNIKMDLREVGWGSMH